MKTMKRLQVATAAASLFALAGAAQAAILNTTGSVLAVETIQPTATGAGIGNLSNVRAPAFTYSYEGGLTVQGQSVQHFSIAATLGGDAGDWSFDNNGDTLVPGTNPLLLDRHAETIAAQLRGVGNAGRRVAVVGPGTAVTAGKFAIVLVGIDRGDRIQGSPTESATSSKSVTYRFQLVNNTNAPLTLSALDLTFFTQKNARGATAPIDTDPSYVVGSLQDSTTSAASQYASIFNLVPLIGGPSSAVGHATGEFACHTEPDRRVTLQVYSGEGLNPTIGPEPNNTAVGGLNATFSRNYLTAKRAIDVIVRKGTDRQIQTTNSFQTNLGSTPVNGIGGTGGGRFTFKPTLNETNARTNNYGGINNNTGAYIVGPVGANNATGRPTETHPTVNWSDDDRSVRVGTISFVNRSSALDRLLDVDAFAFRPQLGARYVGTAGISPGPDVAQGDLTQPTDRNENVFGGVDVAAGANAAVQLTFRSKPNFSGFAGRTGNGTTVPFGIATNTLALVRGTTAGVANVCGATANTPGSRIAINSGVGGNFAESPAGSGNYVLNLTQGAFAGTFANAADATLLGDWHLCYYVTGNVEVPNTFFSNAEARLFKDDTSEQTNVSCPAPLAFVHGGVKVDVRQFQAVTSDDSWSSFVRVINNSESEVATVEAQYIFDSGLYGKWGTLGTLNQRASRIFSSAEIAGLLLTDPISLPAAQINTTVPRDTKLRLRIAADVSTIRVQNFFFNRANGALVEASGAQGADFVNVDSSNRDHIDQDAQTGIVK